MYRQELIFTPAAVVKLPAELISVKPTFPINGIDIVTYDLTVSTNEKDVPLYIAMTSSAEEPNEIPCSLLG